MLLSIITIHLDQFPALQATADSLRKLAQWGDVEWIVIDGGSRPQNEQQEKTLEQVRAAASRFVSEADNGLYDAMNKGTRLSQGDWLLYLNAGDKLHEEFNPAMLAEAVGNGDPAMAWGQSFDCEPGGQPYPRRTRPPRWLRYGTTVAHQAVFFRRRGLGEAPYDLEYDIAADYDLICRLSQAPGSVQLIDLPVCIFELGGFSAADTERTLRQESLVRRKHFGTSGFTDSIIVGIKGLLWKISRRFPGFRKALRGKV